MGIAVADGDNLLALARSSSQSARVSGSGPVMTFSGFKRDAHGGQVAGQAILPAQIV